jgi:hypothetical protein
LRALSEKQGNLLGVLPCFLEWLAVVREPHKQELVDSEAKEVGRYFHSGLETENHKYFFIDLFKVFESRVDL